MISTRYRQKNGWRSKDYNMDSQIRYIKYNELNLLKWRACIRQSSGANLYADPAWLTALAENWDALVYGDYEAIMPLCWRQKGGIRYLYQPAFIQKTNIYSGNPLPASIIQLFIDVCWKQFSFAEIYVGFKPEKRFSEKKNNFVLALNRSYLEIASTYSKDLSNNLRIAGKHPFQYKKSDDADTIIRLFRQHYEAALNYTDQDYANLLHACLDPHQSDAIVVREVQLAGEIQAACLCVRDNQRLYLLLNVTAVDGRKRAANHFLLDQLIREFAGILTLLDMEGSDKEGIAHFYQNFGAVNEPYYFVGWNRLPWPVRWLKPTY